MSTIEKKEIEQYIKNNSLAILAKPNSSKTEILDWNEERQMLKIAINAPPEDNKANEELLKFLKKKLKRKVELIKGKTSREKVVRII